jgi:hypothetical protein
MLSQAILPLILTHHHPDHGSERGGPATARMPRNSTDTPSAVAIMMALERA